MASKPTLNYTIDQKGFAGLHLDIKTGQPSANSSATPDSHNVIIEVNGVKKRIRYSGDINEKIIRNLLEKNFSVPESLLQNNTLKVNYRHQTSKQVTSLTIGDFLSKKLYRLLEKFTLSFEPIVQQGTNQSGRLNALRPQITTQFTADFANMRNSKRSLESIDPNAINSKPKIPFDNPASAVEPIRMPIPPIPEVKQRRLSKAQESVQVTAQFAHLQGEHSGSERNSGFFGSDSAAVAQSKLAPEIRKFSHFGGVFQGQGSKVEVQPQQLYENGGFGSQSRLPFTKSGAASKPKAYFSNQKELTMSVGTKKEDVNKQLLKHQTVSQFQVHGGPLSPNHYQSVGSVPSPGKSVDYCSEQVHSIASNQPNTKLVLVTLDESNIVRQVGRMNRVIVLHTMKTNKYLGKLINLLPKFSVIPTFFTNQVDTYAEESLELSLNYDFSVVLRCDDLPTLISIFCDSLSQPNIQESLIKKLYQERQSRDILIQAVTLEQMISFIKMIDQNEEFQKEILKLWGNQHTNAVDEISNVLEVIFCFYKFRVSSIIRRYTSDIDLSNSGSQMSPQRVREAG